VYADPNYVTGRPPALVSGDPWSGGGSPAGANAAAAAELFWGQWAFRSRGIGLLNEGGLAGARSVPFTGKGARVGVFDTSPFQLNRGVASQLASVDWISPTLDLMVAHPDPAAQLDPPNPAIDVRDHGLFVAGLIHAVAPQSTISLTRVLNEYGQGDLYTLNREVHRFISDTVSLGAAFSGTVINLSLGVHPPPNASELHLPAVIVSLQTALQAADGFKLVVVAAAGNDGNAKQMQIPASNATVIGVAASSAQRGRGCFSNRGDLAAPGGNGSAPGCIPTVDDCEASCAVAVVSLAAIDNPATDTGYAYWTGSSFAAPLASGVAALLLAAKGGELTPAQVAQQIYDGALPPNLPPADDTLGAGIVNLRRTLLPFEAHVPVMIRRP
jgi:subtilisin family serine protease